MPDIVDKEKRRRMMSGIANKNTRPEIIIQEILLSKGFAYRLDNKELPGKPDIILTDYKAAIFINGCFWHCHNCHLFKWPQSRKEFWQQKIMGNKARDEKNHSLLREEGWRVLIVWECALKGKAKPDMHTLITEIEDWIINGQNYAHIQGIMD